MDRGRQAVAPTVDDQAVETALAKPIVDDDPLRAFPAQRGPRSRWDPAR